MLDTGLFDFEQAHQHPLWFKELNGFKDHVPETEEYGIRSFVYRARRPFHPARFQASATADWPGVIRAKGFFWLATRPHYVGELARPARWCAPKRGLWWAAVPETALAGPAGRGAKRCSPISIRSGAIAARRSSSSAPSAMDEAAIRRQLDACLVGDPAHFTPDAWRSLPDPFPNWTAAQAS